MQRSLHTITLGTVLRFIVILILITTLGIYVHYQARNFLAGPVITLTDTYTGAHHEKTIVLEGHAENIVLLTLNGREIHTTEDGVFRETLVLPQGYTIIELYAKDRFGRTQTLTREYVYVPQAV